MISATALLATLNFLGLMIGTPTVIVISILCAIYTPKTMGRALFIAGIPLVLALFRLNYYALDTMTGLMLFSLLTMPAVLLSAYFIPKATTYVYG